MKNIIVTTWLAFALLGCAGGPQTQPSSYVLDPPTAASTTAETATPPANAPVLLIATPAAEAGYDTAFIAYSREPLALSYYRDSRWADTPARMLLPLLAQRLERSGAFRAVVMQPSAARAELLLATRLIELRQDFLTQPSQVRLRLRAELIDTASSRVLASRLFSADRPTPSDDAYGGVQAANAALADVLQALTEFVLSQAS